MGGNQVGNNTIFFLFFNWILIQSSTQHFGYLLKKHKHTHMRTHRHTHTRTHTQTITKNHSGSLQCFNQQLILLYTFTRCGWQPSQENRTIFFFFLFLVLTLNLEINSELIYLPLLVPTEKTTQGVLSVLCQQLTLQYSVTGCGKQLGQEIVQPHSFFCHFFFSFLFVLRITIQSPIYYFWYRYQ